MEYNKKDFQKMNDKKVLHKVRKHWVVVSLAMLMALGGTAVATHVSANADATTGNSNAQSNTQTPKENQSQSLVKPANQNVSAQNNNQAQLSNKGASTQEAISNQASQLHQRILANVAQSPANMNMRKMALTNPHFAHNVGDSSSTTTTSPQQSSNTYTADPHANDRISTKVIHYLNTDQNDQEINEKYDDQVTRASDKFDMTPYLTTLPKGYQLTNGSDTNYEDDKLTNSYMTGHQFNKSSDYPSDYGLGGTQDLYVFVKPIEKVGQGNIQINYVNASDGRILNSVALANNSDQYMTWYNANNLPKGVTSVVPQGGTEKASDVVADLQGYAQTVPVNNYQLYGANSDDGYITFNGKTLSKNTDFNLPFKGSNVVDIKVKPIFNPNATDAYGTVTYENHNDGNAVVSTAPFKETRGAGTNLTQYVDNLPSGYNLAYSGKTNPKNFVEDANWEDGDNDIIYVVPDGTDPNSPDATTGRNTKPGESFITVNYIDQSDGKLINQVNLDGSAEVKTATKTIPSSSFDLSKFIAPSDGDTTNMPTNYVYEGNDNPSLNQFPASDGGEATVNVNVKLDPQDDPTSDSYDPSIAESTNNNYGNVSFEYVDTKTGAPLTHSDGNGHQVPYEDTLTNLSVGSVINYAPYITSVPKGYKYSGMGAHESNVNYDSVVNPAATNGVDPKANVIYVSQVYTGAQQITVNYYNQDGEKLNNPNSDNPSDTVTGTIDTPVNVTLDKNGNSTVPKGYQIIKTQKINYNITNNPQTVNLIVQGQSVTEPKAAKAVIPHHHTNLNGSVTTSDTSDNAVLIDMPRSVKNSDGTTKKLSDFTEVIENPIAGQHVTIKATDAGVLPAGYTPTSSDVDVTYEMLPSDKGGGKAILTQNAPTVYNYTEIGKTKPGAVEQAVVPITVTYKNQHGVTVGKDVLDPTKNTVTHYDQQGTKTGSDALTTSPEPTYSDGDTINIVNPAGEKATAADGQSTTTNNTMVPTGYTLVPNQNYLYKFGDTDPTPTLFVTGNKLDDSTVAKGDTVTTYNYSNNQQTQQPNQQLKKNQIMVNVVEHDASGTHTQSHIMNIDGNIGDSTTITPSDPSLVPSDSAIEPNDPNNVDYTATINAADGTLVTNPAVKNQTVTYDYKKNSGTIHFVYITKNQAGNFYQLANLKGYDLNGMLGTAAPAISNFKLPNGYVMDTTAPANVSGFVDVAKAGSNPYFPTAQVISADTNLAGHSLAFDHDTTLNGGAYYAIPVKQAGQVEVQYVNVTGNTKTPMSDYNKFVTGTAGSKYYVSDSTNPADAHPSDTDMVPTGYTYVKTENNEATYSASDANPAASADGKPSDGNIIYIDVQQNPSVATSNGLGAVTVHYINSSDTNDTNLADQVGEATFNGQTGTSFTASDATDVTTDTPKGYTLETDTNATSAKFAKAPNDVYVYVSRAEGQTIPSYSTVTIEYEDMKHNDNVIKDATVTSTGKTGTPVNYANYQNILPSGYKLMGMKNVTTNYEDGAKEEFLVMKPEPAIGYVNVNYIDAKTGKTISSTPTNAQNNSFFDMSNYENTTPANTHFVSAKAYGDSTTDAKTGKTTVGSQISSNTIDAYDSGTQTLDVYVDQNAVINPFSTINIVYHDVNNQRKDVHQKVTGEVGTLFNPSPFEVNVPQGSTFDGLDQTRTTYNPAATNADGSFKLDDQGNATFGAAVKGQIPSQYQPYSADKDNWPTVVFDVTY